MSNAVARRLGSLHALDESGDPIALGALWEARPVVLCFVRHFG